MPNNLLIDGRIALGAFDFDGNILSPESHYLLINKSTGKPERILASIVDQDPRYIKNGVNSTHTLCDDPEETYATFRDFSEYGGHLGPDQFYKETKEALKHKLLSPSFERFKKDFLIEGRVFSIITARGHSPENLARTIRMINDTQLSKKEKEHQIKNLQFLWEFFGKSGKPTKKMLLDFYFHEIVSYYPVSSPHVSKLLSITTPTSTARKKVIAMMHFISMNRKRLAPLVPGEILAIGFSDDSVENILSLIAYFRFERELPSSILTEDKIRIYFTGKKEDYPLLVAQVPESEEREDMLILKL